MPWVKPMGIAMAGKLAWGGSTWLLSPAGLVVPPTGRWRIAPGWIHDGVQATRRHRGN